jgi:prepilin-type N-terminal cleavage/methylation domain-containing protein
LLKLWQTQPRVPIDAAAAGGREEACPKMSLLRQIRNVAVPALRASEGFTLIEVLVASVILVTGLLALFGMLDVASRATATNRVRQEATSIAREVLEDARTLAYTQLVPGTIASALQPELGTGVTLSGSNLQVTRTSGEATYTFSVSFSVCSLDDPSDGLGSHASAPSSGGSWCPDVSASGTTDTTPDDYKRVSVTVTPTGSRTTPSVQQTVLIYQEDTHGPAVTCLSWNTTCPGTNLTVTTGSSLTFNVTTTSPATRIQWLVNGNPPPAAQIAPGAVDPYAPNGVTSQFTWVYPTVSTSSGVQTVDGTYTITAQAFDADGHAGSKSSLQITVNEHEAIPPGNVVAGWNGQINQGLNGGGGVDVQWTPSVDQDIQYYEVFRQVAGVTTKVCQATGTSCSDLTAASPNPPAVPATCQTWPNTSDTYTTSAVYWVIGVDTDPTTGTARESRQLSNTWDANLCDHPPSAPTNLTVSAVNNQIQLSWTAPASPNDPDSGDSIQGWRVYRWPVSGTMQDPVNRLDILGSSGTTFTDTSPDPAGVPQSYCVTAIDQHLNESTCSNPVSG